MTALITGATAGIGRAFVEVLASEGHDVVLVARDGDRLQAVADDVAGTHGVRAQVVTADLATDDGCARVAAVLRDDPPDVLVNNAGFALDRRFVGGDLAAEERLLDVLVRAPLRLCHAALPGMVERGSGMVLNVSSVAGWLPFGTYSAAKSWLTSFTEGLARELDGSGVTATAVCPGYTRTEFHDRAGMRVSAMPDWAWLDAGRVARDGLADARRGRTTSVPSRRYSALALVVRHAPRGLLQRATTASVARGRRDASQGQRAAGSAR